MDIYIDCEYNGFGGELISMALVAADGKEFYEVLECQQPNAWVLENVIPVLGKEPIEYFEFQSLLYEFLGQFSSVEVIADWPEDMKHFCASLIKGPGVCIKTPPLTMQIIKIRSDSLVPHNALEDARALLDVLQ